MTTPCPSTSSSDAVISVAGVSRHFGGRRALDQVTLHVPRGAVFGLVGENGAGKTTLIQHILGLLAPESGTVRVFGRDPVADPIGVLGRTGYLSERRDLPGWMRIDELLRYTRAFYPRWDGEYAESLRQRFALPSSQKVQTLSQGQQAKAGLIVALAFRPELLLLDEPSSGLDPVVRREILEAIIRTVAEDRRTVFFSSHLLDEIERVCDHIAMIRAGRIVLFGRLDDIKQGHRRLHLHFDEPCQAPPALEALLTLEGAGRDWTGLFRGDPMRLLAMARAAGATVVAEEVPSLDEVFVAQTLVDARRGADPHV
ncbi:MAG: ABC transporter ATP-binding protein [Verrucomicrobiales bacterium]|nr:ABC transporter ATP-binding protein [Verrucomicrobiales bacterium]